MAAGTSGVNGETRLSRAVIIAGIAVMLSVGGGLVGGGLVIGDMRARITSLEKMMAIHFDPDKTPMHAGARIMFSQFSASLARIEAKDEAQLQKLQELTNIVSRMRFLPPGASAN